MSSTVPRRSGRSADPEPGGRPGSSRLVCVHRMVEAQAARLPTAIAATHRGRALSYGELNEQASALARRLTALGVGPDVLGAVFAERSLELVVALLGVLKAGGAYVPLDPTYPDDRLAWMLG